METLPISLVDKIARPGTQPDQLEVDGALTMPEIKVGRVGVRDYHRDEGSEARFNVPRPRRGCQPSSIFLSIQLRDTTTT